jgi:hypothetical protein
MKKKAASKKYTQKEPLVSSTANEPLVGYMPQSLKVVPIVAEFGYKRFKKIAEKVPFTIKDWSKILHLSERTLQRYAKDNISFEGIYVDRMLHIEQLINLGLQTFTSPKAFYDWLKKDKVVFGQPLNMESLASSYGIQETINQVGRILHNVYT